MPDIEEEYSPIDKSADSYPLSFPEPTEEQSLILKSRLEDLYSSVMICEFEGCSEKATHHCIDVNLHWKGCGRIICDGHAKSMGNSEDGEALAFVC